jgi:hypothetical protein
MVGTTYAVTSTVFEPFRSAASADWRRSPLKRLDCRAARSGRQDYCDVRGVAGVARGLSVRNTKRIDRPQFAHGFLTSLEKTGRRDPWSHASARRCEAPWPSGRPADEIPHQNLFGLDSKPARRDQQSRSSRPPSDGRGAFLSASRSEVRRGAMRSRPWDGHNPRQRSSFRESNQTRYSRAMRLSRPSENRPSL